MRVCLFIYYIHIFVVVERERNYLYFLLKVCHITNRVDSLCSAFCFHFKNEIKSNVEFKSCSFYSTQR